MEIRPFRAVRPLPERAKKIVSVPYDVISRDEARKVAEGAPESFLRVVRSDLEFPNTVDPYAPEIYERAKENLAELLASGAMLHEAEPQLYLYRQSIAAHSQTGVVCVASLAEYDHGDIRIHEHTRHEKELDRIRHITTTGLQAEPVFLTYRATEEVDRLVLETTTGTSPLFDITTEDGVHHEIWTVELYGEFLQAFRDVPRMYIADGHHRSAAAAKARAQIAKARGLGALSADDPAQYVLATIFPHNQLNILPYNRVIRESELADEEILEALGTSFHIRQSNSGIPAKTGIFELYLSGFWYQLELRDEARRQLDNEPPGERLDVSKLQRFALSPVFGIEDPRTDKNIDFVGGIRGIGELERVVNSGDARCAFSLFPVTMDDLFEIADRGEIMPPKSTWFEPKLRSGFFAYPLWQGSLEAWRASS